MARDERRLGFIEWLILIAAVLLLVDMIYTVAYAGGTKVTQSNDMNNQTAGDIKLKSVSSLENAVNVGTKVSVGGPDINVGGTTVPVTQGSVTGGDNNIGIGGDKAYALAAPGLGDVDIAQCLGSEAWTLLVGGKQKLVLNQVCMAEFYLKQGRYDLAAQALCNQPEIVDEYESESACEADHYFAPSEPVAVAMRDEPDHDDEDDHRKYEAEIAALAERLKASEKKAKKATLEARYAVQQTQEQQHGLSDEQVKDLEAWEQRWQK